MGWRIMCGQVRSIDGKEVGQEVKQMIRRVEIDMRQELTTRTTTMILREDDVERDET